MDTKQIQVIKCAYADLVGVYQSAYNSECLHVMGHNWKAHKETIHEMEEAFNFIEPISLDGGLDAYFAEEN